jgi:hypothetical protein
MLPLLSIVKAEMIVSDLVVLSVDFLLVLQTDMLDHTVTMNVTVHDKMLLVLPLLSVH